MIKLIFRPVRLIFLLTFFWIAINILKDENSKTQDPEEVAWCKEYKPNLSFEECVIITIDELLFNLFGF